MSLHVAFSPVYVHPVPENHRFPMEKYQLIYEQLLRENISDPSHIFTPGEIPEDLVLEVHDPAYFDRLKNLQLSPREQRISGFVHSKELIHRELVIMEGTRMAAEIALRQNVAMNIAGGTHHAYSDRGEGFCLLNDQAIAAAWLLRNKLASRILIIDLDVHQGNGTAEIFASNPSVFTFSMHGASNYPLKKEKSDLDAALEDGVKDAEYLRDLAILLSRIFGEFQPDFLFYQSGVDVLESDKLGKLSLSIQGCRERDRLVFEFAAKRNLPVVCSMGGGYGSNIRAIVEAHINTFRIASNYSKS